MQLVVPHAAFVPNLKNLAELDELLKLIGVEQQSADDTTINILRPEELEKKEVRIRHDGDRVFWTVKMTRKQAEAAGMSQEDYAVRAEQEVELTEAGEAEVTRLLHEIGYIDASIREKLRTTFNLNDTEISIDIPPFTQVPPWIEIEGKPEAIDKAVALLGLTGQQENLSDSKLYERYGITKDEMRNAVFPTEKHS